MMHTVVFVGINPHTNFEVHSIIHSRDIIGPQNLKMGHVILTMPLSGTFAIRSYTRYD